MKPERPPSIPTPAHVHVEARDGELVITRRWRTRVHDLFAVVCVVVGAAGVLEVQRGGLGALDARDWVFGALMSVCVYYTLTGFVNSTTVTVAFDALRVRHGPLPWLRDVDVSRASIAQLSVREVVTKVRGGVARTYHVSANLSSGRSVMLVEGLPTPDDARFLEHELERHLGIRDQHVPGEHRAPRT
ncbi:hypothetical protein L6R52_11855 [Myxococcota bacterium]|nr:hypothetical protein [Myxococcota bacterium]